jgi:hypothetical protein
MSDTDNASILTAATQALERYRADERALEVEIAILTTRLDAVREFVSALSGKPRTRRPRTPRPVEPTGEPTDAIDAFADAVA